MSLTLPSGRVVETPEEIAAGLAHAPDDPSVSDRRARELREKRDARRAKLGARIDRRYRPRYHRRSEERKADKLFGDRSSYRKQARADGVLQYERPLSDRQWDVFSDTHRWRVLIAGRRFGKTFLACAELIVAALSTAGVTVWYVAPTYRMAKDIAWETLKALCASEYIKGEPNESTLTIRLKNGSVISLKGAEKFDRLRGRSLWLVVVDEFAQVAEGLFEEVIRPSLADMQGRALFIGTPAGFNWAYDLWLRGYDAEKWPNWKAFQFTTVDGGRVTPDELDDARREMQPRIYRQEFLASFEALQGRVYDQFDRAANSSASLIDPGEAIARVNALVPDRPQMALPPILVGMDFNINPMTAVCAVRVGEECHVLRSIEIMSSNTEEMACEIERAFPKREIICYPDPAAESGSTKAPVGVTDVTILKRHGFKIRILSSHNRVVDRINAVQAMLCDAAGRRRLLFHPRATHVTKALDGLTYKKDTSEPDKKSPHIHITDALGYLIEQEFNLLRSRSWLTTPVRT